MRTDVGPPASPPRQSVQGEDADASRAGLSGSGAIGWPDATAWAGAG